MEDFTLCQKIGSKDDFKKNFEAGKNGQVVLFNQIFERIFIQVHVELSSIRYSFFGFLSSYRDVIVGDRGTSEESKVSDKGKLIFERIDGDIFFEVLLFD